MTNLEFYKGEFTEMLKTNSIMLCKSFKVIDETYNDCDVCPFDVENCAKNGKCNYLKFIDWLLEEHKEPIKLKQWEKDLLKCCVDTDLRFNYYKHFKDMKEKGYYRGITDTSMKVGEILENCEVIEK